MNDTLQFQAFVDGVPALGYICYAVELGEGQVDHVISVRLTQPRIRALMDLILHVDAYKKTVNSDLLSMSFERPDDFVVFAEEHVQEINGFLDVHDDLDTNFVQTRFNVPFLLLGKAVNIEGALLVVTHSVAYWTFYEEHQSIAYESDVMSLSWLREQLGELANANAL